MDRTARWGITVGGITVIVCILGILVFIALEIVPLWRGAKVELSGTFPAGEPARTPILGVNEYREISFSVSDDGSARILALPAGEVLSEAPLAPLAGRRITAASPLAPDAEDWIAGTDDGQLVQVTLKDGLRFTEDGRRYAPQVETSGPIALEDGGPVRLLGTISIGKGFVAAVWTGTDSVAVVRREERTSLLGVVSTSDRIRHLPLPTGSTPTALAIDYEAAHAFVGTREGDVLEYELKADEPRPVRYPVLRNSAIRSLRMLVGGHSLVVGGESGELEVWFRARPSPESPEVRLIRGHTFRPHGHSVVGIAASKRDKSFVTWDSAGQARLHFSTSGETRLEFTPDETGIEQLVLSPKGDGILASDRDGVIRSWDLSNPYPEASPRALFGKILYEGFSKPAYVWQSTGATDEFEPKLSLIPLIFGTLKGTFYALLFSVPIAILAAVYTALFMHPRIREVVKPAMEMMAALPSVVLGFLAGLWLAPALERSMPAALLLPFVLVPLVLAFGLLWSRLPLRAAGRLWPGVETAGIVLVLLFGIDLFLRVNPSLNHLFQGGFLDWLYRNVQIRYDQRNALVIGIAMGLAVIPIIFTISEDSLVNVPRSLRAASLALGASPWQTAWRVILPAASPGIFAAVVIGLGRAVGETMIVLMATGNTPIMDWIPFNGFRTLAANIAVEIPEAPHQGTLYRVLFLTAFLLFALTFVVNTVAELVRQRLRAKYSRF